MTKVPPALRPVLAAALAATIVLASIGPAEAQKRGGTLTIVEAVHLVTGRTASFFGLHDRGVVAVGKAADLAVFALDEIELHQEVRAYDVPFGSWRLTRPPAGFRATLANGVPTFIVNAGTPVPFSGRSTDPGSDDLTLTWDWDDGAPSPDVTVVSLHAPPATDPDPSPDGTARDVTNTQTHTFGDACFYDVVFASADDDGGAASDDIAVVVVGNFTDTRSHGYFKNELGKLKDHTAAGAQCLLDITGFMSQVFHEVRNASTPALAIAVFDKSGSSRATDIFDVQLLAAWMNFADGRVALTDLVDTNFDHVPDTTFAALVAQAEAVRLNPASTRAQILAQKDRLESFNLSGI